MIINWDWSRFFFPCCVWNIFRWNIWAYIHLLIYACNANIFKHISVWKVKTPVESSSLRLSFCSLHQKKVRVLITSPLSTTTPAGSGGFERFIFCATEFKFSKLLNNVGIVKSLHVDNYVWIHEKRTGQQAIGMDPK